MSQSIIYPKDVIEAYEKHGDKFLDIDIENVRENFAKTVKYTKIKMTKANGVVINPIIKFFNQLLSNKIRVPADREYEQLKVAIRRDHETNPEDQFGKAVNLICNAFTKRIKELKNLGLISDDIDDDNNKDNVVIFPSCKPQTPLQRRAKDREGNLVEIDNPMFWFGLNFKRYTPDEEKELKVLDFNYKKDNKKFVVKDFDIRIFDIDDLNNSNRPNLAKIDDNLVNNTNIQDFLTLKSLVSGTIYMQVVISNQSCNLNTKVSSSLYVKSNKNPTYVNVFNDDEFEMMMEGSKKMDNESDGSTAKSVQETKEEKKDDDDYEEDDSYSENSNLDKIKNLTL